MDAFPNQVDGVAGRNEAEGTQDGQGYAGFRYVLQPTKKKSYILSKMLLL